MNIEILLVPYDSGRRGERMGAGPEILRAGLVKRLEQGGHNVHCRTIELPSDRLFGEFQAAFEIGRLVCDGVRAARDSKSFPLVLAGNCGASLGVVAALGPTTRVIWADAHADFNTPETSISGFLDGMSLATLTGRCWRPATQRISGFVPVKESDVLLVGARHLDPLEEEALAASDIRRVTAAEFDPATLAQFVTGHSESCFHLHLDLDVLDPTVGCANSFAVPGGLSANQLTEFCSLLAMTTMPDALTMSAYDPKADMGNKISDVAVEIAAALFSST